MVGNKKWKTENWKDVRKTKCFNCEKDSLPNKVKFIKSENESKDENHSSTASGMMRLHKNFRKERQK